MDYHQLKLFEKKDSHCFPGCQCVEIQYLDSVHFGFPTSNKCCHTYGTASSFGDQEADSSETDPKKSIATEHQRRWTTVHRRVLSWCLPAVLIAHRQHILGQKSGSSPSDLQVKTWRAHLPQAVQFQCQISPPPQKKQLLQTTEDKKKVTWLFKNPFNLK